jgi:hypothetical protein
MPKKKISDRQVKIVLLCSSLLAIKNDQCGGDLASTWVVKHWEHSGDCTGTSLKTYKL